MKRVVPTIILISALAVFGIAVYKPWIGGVVETWEGGNGRIRVRVENRSENFAPVLPGAYYIFSSSTPDATAWREIMTVRHDDPGGIPHENVRFVNEQVAYVFMGWMYAVTTDGGTNWSVWDARNDWRDECANYGLIKDVHITPDGAGVMTLSHTPSCADDVPTLQTRDYGRHWIP